MSSALLSGLIDDAALFPPGNAPMPDAVAAHRDHLRAPYADLLGPFLCPVARVEELRAELRPGDRIRLGLLAPADRAGLADAVRAVTADDRLRLDRVELPADPATLPGLDDLLPPDVPVYVELPWDGPATPADLRAIRSRQLFAKFRTGGAFVPPVDALAERIVACTVGVPVPFKCTAGLHAAVRHDGAHGFLNVLAAAGTAARGGDPAPLLAESDAAVLIAATRTADTRGAFASFGSCSIDEPVADLRTLGLLAGDAA